MGLPWPALGRSFQPMPTGENRRPFQLGPLGRTVAPFLSAAIVLVFGVMAYDGVQNTRNATRLVTHTHQVIETNSELLARLVDAETGERGYIITGDTTYLDPYSGAEEDANSYVADLRRLTVDNPAQQARVDTLADLVHRRFAVLGARIATRRDRGFERVRSDFETDGGGKPLMDSARAVLGEIGRDETRLLESRTASQRATQSQFVWIVVLGAGAAALLALVISSMLSQSAASEARLSREVRQRAEEAETAASRLHEQAVEMEMMNDELQANNEQLRSQAAEMETLNAELQTTNDRLAERTIEAEQANRVKAEFLANMSHDLRTPLNAIVGYVDLLETGVHGPLGTEQSNDLFRIKRSAAHLRGLITEVLNFAKIEAGQVQMSIDEFPMDAVLADLRPIVEQQIAAKGLTLETSCPVDLVVRADREKVDQILVNLVANAIKFTDGGGKVEIECRADGTWSRTDVRDTGGGIPPGQLDAIFVPFLQLEASGYRGDDRGVGLGLAISRQLARAMRGDVTVSSVLGGGSTFTLRLPRAKA
jgi:signal transduction histidine kinase